MTRAMLQSADRPCDVNGMPEGQARHIDQDRLLLLFTRRVPTYWRSPVSYNPYAEEAERCITGWFARLGCSPDELQWARNFDIAGYVGIPFPGLSRDSAILIGKYFSLWLLWKGVHTEPLENQWRIEAAHVITGCRPLDMTRLEEGWWELFSELSGRRTWRWMQETCEAMATWSDAATEEALWIKAHRSRGTLPGFAEQLEMRIATLGMNPTLYLLEDTYDFELPPSFHEHPTVKALKRTSNEIVGLGNDIFRFGKDPAEDPLNLVSTLMRERRLSGEEALELVIRQHDGALERYDRLAVSLESWGPEVDLFIAQWLQDVRYAALGFSLWEAQAPRYPAHKNGVTAPAFGFSESGPSAHVDTCDCARGSFKSTAHEAIAGNGTPQSSCNKQQSSLPSGR